MVGSSPMQRRYNVASVGDCVRDAPCGRPVRVLSVPDNGTPHGAYRKNNKQLTPLIQNQRGDKFYSVVSAAGTFSTFSVGSFSAVISSPCAFHEASKAS